MPIPKRLREEKRASPLPTRVDDLQYDEAIAVLVSIFEVELSDSEANFYMDWLEIQFPNTNISGLIYWPHEWLQDHRADQSTYPQNARKSDDTTYPLELSMAQVMEYAMIRSSRTLPGRPEDVDLPYVIRPFVAIAL